jgi:hypothetical protein
MIPVIEAVAFASVQDMAALVLVVSAAGYLAWQGWRVVRKKSAGCGGCGSCASTQPRESQPFVEAATIKQIAPKP